MLFYWLFCYCLHAMYWNLNTYLLIFYSLLILDLFLHIWYFLKPYIMCFDFLISIICQVKFSIKNWHQCCCICVCTNHTTTADIWWPVYYLANVVILTDKIHGHSLTIGCCCIITTVLTAHPVVFSVFFGGRGVILTPGWWVLIENLTVR